MVAFAVWGACALAGTYWLLAYKQTPGAGAAELAPRFWPPSTKVERDPSRYTLVMVLHPKCTCSRASLGELVSVLDRSEGRVAARLLFVRPKGVSDSWIQSDTFERAQTIRDATVIVDEGGAEAARFGAATSGQTYLYSPAGALLFEGGVTASRGHYGDNAGTDAILALLHDAPAAAPSAVASTNVYGCEVADKDQRTASQGGGSSK